MEELLASPIRIRSVLTSPALRETPRGVELEARVIALSIESELAVSQATDAEMSAAASTDTPQGIIAIAEQPERSFESIGDFGTLLVLDAVQDPGNVGTILRTAQAFGVAATIALPGTADLWNAKVVRSAMGALFSHVAFHADRAAVLEFVAARHAEVWATSTDGESLRAVSRSQRGGNGLAIVVGNEANGVSADIMAAASRTVAIPILGVESLNVAVATGILLYAITHG